MSHAEIAINAIIQSKKVAMGVSFSFGSLKMYKHFEHWINFFL